MSISAIAPIRFVVLLTSIALALLLLLTGAVVAQAGTSEAAVGQAVVLPKVQHQVESGDTLWDIAAQYTPPGEDVRVMIHDIKLANGLESSGIEVGQVLIVPVEF